MSDTYITATPVTEDHEMGRVREIFDRAINAMVDASSLAKSVETLRTDLEGLKGQVQHYRNTIANQDDQITRLRQDRDAARTAQYQAEDSARHMVTDLENSKREVESLSGANVRLNDRISAITNERDEAQLKLTELQESSSALSKKMDDLKALLGFVEPPKPDVKEVLDSYATPEPVAEAKVVDWSAPVTEMTPLEPEPPALVPEPVQDYPKDIR